MNSSIEDKTNYTEWTRAEIDEYNRLHPMAMIDIQIASDEDTDDECSNPMYKVGMMIDDLSKPQLIFESDADYEKRKIFLLKTQAVQKEMQQCMHDTIAKIVKYAPVVGGVRLST